MKDGAEHVSQRINGNPVIQAAVPNGIYWELAPEVVENPYCTYRLRESPGVTKDSDSEYRVNVFVWHNSLDEAVTLADMIKTQIKESGGVKWKFIDGGSGYTDTDAKTAYIELVFIFKL